MNSLLVPETAETFELQPVETPLETIERLCQVHDLHWQQQHNNGEVEHVFTRAGTALAAGEKSLNLMNACAFGQDPLALPYPEMTYDCLPASNGIWINDAEVAQQIFQDFGICWDPLTYIYEKNPKKMLRAYEKHALKIHRRRLTALYGFDPFALI